MPYGSAIDFLLKLKQKEEAKRNPRNTVIESSSLETPSPRAKDKPKDSKRAIDSLMEPRRNAKEKAVRVLEHVTTLGLMTMPDRCRQLEMEFKKCKLQVPILCKSLGLPKIDIDLLITPHLLSTSTAEVEYLTALMNTMRRHDLCTETAMSHITQRERLMREVRGSCACVRDTMCSTESHKKLIELVNEIDAITTHIMRCIAHWREALNNPLPFPYHGENYIFRIVNDASLIKRVVFHLSMNSRITDGSASPTTKWGFAKLRSSAVDGWGRYIPEEVRVASREHDMQTTWCQRALGLARRGLYVPILTFHGASPIFVESTRRKRELLMVYTAAIQMLKDKLEMTCKVDIDLKALSKELAGCSGRLGFSHYWNVWYQFVKLRTTRRILSDKILAKVGLCLRQRRFNVWRSVAAIRVAHRADVIYAKIKGNRSLLKRYISKWYCYVRLRKMVYVAKEDIVRRYYQSLLFMRNHSIAKNMDIKAKYLWYVTCSTPSRPLGNLHGLLSFQCFYRPRLEITLLEDNLRRKMFTGFCLDISSTSLCYYESVLWELRRSILLKQQETHYAMILSQEGASLSDIESEYEMIKHLNTLHLQVLSWSDSVSV